MFDPSRPFADPARSAAWSEYDPELHGWLDQRAPRPFEMPAAAVASAIGGLLAIGFAIAAVHEARR